MADVRCEAEAHVRAAHARMRGAEARARDVHAGVAEARNVLKVATGASEEEIRRAYRREALRCHPDKNPDHTEAATVSFQHVQTAFVMLLENDAESCKENIREEPGALVREYIERAKASLNKQQFLGKTHWKRVPSRSRPGQFSYEHPSGLRQRAFPSHEPTARDIADWNRSQNRSLGAEQRGAVLTCKAVPQPCHAPATRTGLLRAVRTWDAGQLAPTGQCCMCAVREPPHVPRTVAPQARRSLTTPPPPTPPRPVQEATPRERTPRAQRRARRCLQ